MADSPRPIWAWPGLGPRPGHALIFVCLAGPGKKNCLAQGPRVPARAGSQGPGPTQFFLPGPARQKKLKHGLALAQGQARPKWVLGSRPRPGNKIYIMYYILYILLYYYIIILLYYYIITLSYYSDTTLVYLYIIILLYYHIIILLYYYIIILLYYCIIVLLY